MNVTPPPTHLTETSTPDAGTLIDNVGELAQTGANTVPLIIFAVLLIGAGIAVMWLRAYTSIRQGNGLTPLPHGQDHMEAWHDIVHDLVALGVPRDVAIDTATAELGWKPGDRL